jgi:FkbM family methyltransferase
LQSNLYQQMKKRPGTSDHAIIMNVMVNNEYKLPDDMKGWIVIDIGAHIGAFSLACVERGAKFVLAVEPVVENLDLLRENTKACEVGQVFGAIWGEPVKSLAFGGFPVISENEINTGGTRLEPGEGQNTLLNFYSLDDIIRDSLLYLGKVDLIKMDCEYAEWDILYGGDCFMLRHVPRVIGEFHEDPTHPRFLNCNEKGLINFFQDKGYIVRTQRHGNSNLGLFWAERP